MVKGEDKCGGEDDLVEREESWRDLEEEMRREREGGSEIEEDKVRRGRGEIEEDKASRCGRPLPPRLAKFFNATRSWRSNSLGAGEGVIRPYKWNF